MYLLFLTFILCNTVSVFATGKSIQQNGVTKCYQCGYSVDKEYDEMITVPREVIDVIEVPKVVSKAIKVPRVISRDVHTPRIVEDAFEVSRIVETAIKIPKIIEEEVTSSRLVHNEVKVPRIVIDHVTVTKEVLIDEVLPQYIDKIITAPKTVSEIVEKPVTITKMKSVPVVKERQITVSRKVNQPIKGKKGVISHLSKIVEDVKTETYNTFDSIVVTEQAYISEVNNIEIPKSNKVSAISSKIIQVPHLVQEIQKVPREVVDIQIHTSIAYDKSILTKSIIEDALVTNVEYKTNIVTRTVIDKSTVTETVYDDLIETYTEFETQEQVRTVYDNKTIHRSIQGGWKGCAGQLTKELAESNGVDVWDCMNHCYVKLDQSGNLYRGCYKGETGINPDKLGCTSYGKEKWCFCKGDLCNKDLPH